MHYKPIFITGTARSGSTLLCKILNVNKDIFTVSDPYFPLFHSLRNAIVKNNLDLNNNLFDPQSPLQDYYFNLDNINILEAVQKSDLNIPFDKKEFPVLLESVRARASIEYPDLVHEINDLLGLTYKEVFDNALKIINKSCNDKSKKFIGFKDVWIIEFFAPLARSYPDAKFIVIQRDPRAIISSMINVKEQDPSQVAQPLSYIRHWRKYTSFMLKYKTMDIFKDRLHILKFEDLAKDPQREVKKICDFLEVDFDHQMLDSDHYFDYSTGKMWQGNSSFQEKIQGISSEVVDRWKTKLDLRLLKVIEFFCSFEMDLEGYKKTINQNLFLDLDIISYIIDNNDNNYNWRSDFSDPQKDLGFELFRHALIKINKDHLNENIIRKSFLFREVFDKIKNDIR